MKRKWKCPSQQPEYRKAVYDKKKKEVFEKLGNCCFRCGFSDPRALQIDHVSGAGSVERRSLNGIPYLNKVLKVIDAGAYQLLCANCNWIKRSESEHEQPIGKQVFIESDEKG